jgi:hypothetical protein
MSATRKSVKDMADRLISTLDSMMPSERADAIVRDVAEELYNDVLDVKGRVVIDRDAPTGIAHGSFGNGRRAMPIAKYKFESEAKR